MAKNYLGNTSLKYLWGRIQALFVAKETGKGLSTNDYTTEEKKKLAGLNNYTLPAAKSDTLGGIKVGAGLSVTDDGILSATGGGTADAVEWDNVIGKPTKVSEFENDSNFQTDTQVASTVNAAVEAKATETKEYVDGQLAIKADSVHKHTKSDITDFPTNVSEFTNDSGYQTAANVESTLISKGYLTAVPDEYVTDTELSGKGYQTSEQVETAITSKGYQTSSQVETAISTKGYVTDTQVTTKLNDYAKKSDIASVYKYKGTVSTYAELPSSDQQVGDTYNVETADAEHNVKAGDNVSWNGTAWDVLAGTVDLSGYVEDADLVEITTEEIDDIISSLS